MMISKIEFRIEGLNPEGEWHMLGQAMGTDADHAAQRDHVISLLRQSGITRYSKVRLVKHVTTIEVVAEDITV